MSTSPQARTIPPKVMGSPDSHGAMREVLGGRPPCKVLDAATGQGVIAQYLLERGWDVHCADIAPDNFPLEGVPFTKADLNRPLDFPDESFDAIVFSNAVHRLFNPGGAIREFARILRPGGTLYLNANNYATLDLRLHFLLYGSIEYRDPMECAHLPPEAGVRINIMYPRIADYLESAGLEIVSLTPSAVRPRHRLLRPFAWLLRQLTRLLPSHKRALNRVDETSSDAILGGGYYMLIEARKRGATSGA